MSLCWIYNHTLLGCESKNSHRRFKAIVAKCTTFVAVAALELTSKKWIMTRFQDKKSDS
jgi:hypothetical protein